MKTARSTIGGLAAAAMAVATVAAPPAGAAAPAGMVLIPGGSFEMGDHQGFVDPKHGGDETPVHAVTLDPFHMGIDDVTTREFIGFLNAAQAKGQIEVRDGGVYLKGGKDLLCETRTASSAGGPASVPAVPAARTEPGPPRAAPGGSPFSRIAWDGRTFSVLDGKDAHPVVCLRWEGAAAYCNWRSATEGRPACYDTSTWACDFNRSGYRLPTEAEWEFAARGGRQAPYANFPWGDEADATRANWPESRNPFRSGPQPWTTPVGFFDGALKRKADFGWPGPMESYQTANGANGYGLHDMSGNVWQFVNDWYARDYYAYGPAANPPGPERGSLMPDGKPYRGMRGGNWFNGENGHGRVANRNPSYWRGPQDPDHPYYHIGFRVVLPVNAEARPAIAPTPAPARDVRGGGREADGRAPGGGEPRPVSPVQTAIDVNGDGALDATEIAAAPQSIRKADANRDGMITADEYRPPRPEGDRGGRSGEAERGESGGPGGPAGAARERPAPPEGTGSGRADAPAIDAPRRPVDGFVLHSPAVGVDGVLPKEFTGDGDSVSPPLEWTGAPAGTKSYALVMQHIAPDGEAKWYWTLYNIPADVQSLPREARGIGSAGNNSVNGRAEYAPPRSKGPGAKTYTITLYALSAPLTMRVPADRVDRETLLAAVKDALLGSAELSVVYARQGTDGAPDAGLVPDRPDDRQPRGQDRPAGQTAGRPDNPSPRDGDRPEQRGNAPSGERPAREENRPGGGGDGGGRREMPENKTPVSPNPGQTVGLFLNTDKACPGYTLMAPKHNTVTYLLDNQGRYVHSWKSEYEPGQTVYLLPNGHLLRSGMVRVQGGTGGGEGGRIEEFDWDGNLVWEFTHATRDYQLHHDIKPLPNGNILALMVERKTKEQALAAGFDANMMRDDFLVPDAVVEIQPLRPKGGRIVWEWHVWDHLIQDGDRSKPNYGDPAQHPELIYVNCNGRPTAAFWNHMNSLDYNARLDQIVLSVRGCNEIWIIDHGTTMQQAAGHTGGTYGRGGDLLYRWGNPAAYKRGTLQDKQLVQQHDALWIPDGYPGAGHMTIFNNGYDRGWSSVEEIVLPVDARGRYLLDSGKAYGPAKPVWHYEAPNRTDFFSAEISGACRLPNGNTLICGGIVGNLFEVTPAGETVWQYVNPMVRGGILAQGELPGKDMRGHLWNAVFQVNRYAPDYAGLKGRDLTPKGVIELPADRKGKTGMHLMTEAQRTDRGPGGQGGGGRPGGGRQEDRR